MYSLVDHFFFSPFRLSYLYRLHLPLFSSVGYYAYMGYILLEHTHANPVLNVFFDLLSEEIKRKHNCSLRSSKFVSLF